MNMTNHLMSMFSSLMAHDRSRCHARQKRLKNSSHTRPPKPKTPEPLPLDLLNKAIEDPGSLTEKDRLVILDWVPEAEADERCREACGMTWQELITTAVEQPGNLTSDDVSFIEMGRYTTYKVNGAGYKRDFLMLMRHPEEVRNLW